MTVGTAGASAEVVAQLQAAAAANDEGSVKSIAASAAAQAQAAQAQAAQAAQTQTQDPNAAGQTQGAQTQTTDPNAAGQTQGTQPQRSRRCALHAARFAEGPAFAGEGRTCGLRLEGREGAPCEDPRGDRRTRGGCRDFFGYVFGRAREGGAGRPIPS